MQVVFQLCDFSLFDTKGINETKRINGIEPSRLIIGACVTHNSGKKHIIIHKNAWILSNTAEKRLLIFHELSHCVFNSDHNNTKLKGKEISIMSSVLINSNQYKQYYGYYDMQLMLSTRLDLHKVIKDKAITFSDYVLKYMLIVEEGYKKKLKNIKKQLRLNKK